MNYNASMVMLPTFGTSDWIAIITAIVGIGALIVGLIQVRIAKNLAERSGQLKQSELKLSFGHIALQKRSLNIIYGTSRVSDNPRAMILRLLIANGGNRAAEHVKLGVILPAGANAGWEHASYSPRAGISPGFESRAAKIGHLVQSDIYIPVLTPGETSSFDQPFWLAGPTQIDRHIEATTKDNVNVDLTARVFYSLEFDVTLRSKEDEPISGRIYVEAFPASDIGELVQQCVQHSGSSREEHADGRLRRYGDQISAWLFPTAKEFLLIMPAFHSEPEVANSGMGFEDVDRSERWLLTKRRKWALRKVEWRFGPSN